MLDKLGGAWAPRPSTGPHKLRECLPLVILLRNRLKYALNYRETMKILSQRTIRVDGQVRTDKTFPAGFMDVVSIDKTNEFFRLLYNTKGRFQVHRIEPEEASYKLCKVRKVETGPKGIPYAVTHDGRTIRFPHPNVRANDTLKVDLNTGTAIDYAKFETGNICMITGGRNQGRIGIVTRKEKHPGSFDIVHVRDAVGHTFATRLGYCFIIGKGTQTWVSIPKNKGVKASIADDRKKRLDKQKAKTA